MVVRTKTGAQRAAAVPVPIPSALIADPLRTRRADCFLEFLLNDEFDSAPNSLPH